MPPQPLRALPEVARRDDEAQRPPVLGLERLAVRLPGDERIVVLERLEWKVGGEPLFGVRKDEVRALLGLHELRELAPVHALERRVEPAPACHAVDVRRDLCLRQRLQLVVTQRDRALDLAEDLEVPRGEIRLRTVPRAGRATFSQVLAPASRPARPTERPASRTLAQSLREKLTLSTHELQRCRNRITHIHCVSLSAQRLQLVVTQRTGSRPRRRL